MSAGAPPASGFNEALPLAPQATVSPNASVPTRGDCNQKLRLQEGAQAFRMLLTTIPTIAETIAPDTPPPTSWPASPARSMPAAPESIGTPRGNVNRGPGAALPVAQTCELDMNPNRAHVGVVEFWPTDLACGVFKTSRQAHDLP